MKIYRFISALFLLAAVAASTAPTVYAWDFGGSTISDYNNMEISTTGGSYSVKFSPTSSSGGLNALHITTSKSSPYGQVSTVSSDSGTFYLSETGGRGYFDEAILMVAVKAPDSGEELSEDLKINIKASGYRWTAKDTAPYAEDIKYVANSVDSSFGLNSITYGSQSWKPAKFEDYPIMYDQSSSDEFYLFFVDTGVGLIGPNIKNTDIVYSSLRDSGMARIDYSVENYNGETIVFNLYGYVRKANAATDAIAWTNSNSGTEASGYTVLLGSSGPADSEFSNSDAIDYGGDGYVSYSRSGTWAPSVGNLNITSEPAGAKIFIDGADSGEITNASFIDFPAGNYHISIELPDYDPSESDDVKVKKGYVTTRHYNLTPSSCTCNVLADIRGARIYIDGEETLCYANWTFTDIPAGNHTVALKTKDGRMVSKEIYVGRDNEARVFFETSSGDQFASEIKSEAGNDFEESSGNIAGSTGPRHETDNSDLAVPSEDESLKNDQGFLEQLFSFIGGITSPESTRSPVVSGFSGPDEKLPINSTANREIQNEEIGNNSVETIEEPADENANVQQATIGSVYVTSYPKGLHIYVDKVDTDYITPHLVYGLKEGYHNVLVKREAVFSESEEVYISAGETTEVFLNSVAMDEKTVSLSVTSRDIGSFSVNGELPYFDTPAEIKAESFGSYLTYNDGENYYSVTLPFLSGGESVVLKKTENVGSLSITSDPSGAEIYVDSLRTGYITPCIMDNIGDGYHRLKVTKEGYLPVEKEISFVSKGNVVDDSNNFILEEISTGNLTVESDPTGSMIFLRGDYTGQVTPYTFEGIPIGTYDIGVMFNRTIFKNKEVTVLSSKKYGDTCLSVQLDTTD